MRRVRTTVVLAFSLLAWSLPARSFAPERDQPVTVQRAEGEIVVDGDLSDPGWQNAERIETWWEIRPGDNIAPGVKNVAWIAYDDRFLYAAFSFQDPEPERIRAPLGDRDHLPSSTDYGGVIVDANNDAKTAQMFLANARGIQYDALTSDASGEDSAPDFFWEAQGRITEDGWDLEMRIPFSSLRYAPGSDQMWRILLYRNRPRDYRYQMFTAPLPRDVNCFICNSRPLVGLEELPTGSHWVVAPYASGRKEANADEAGSPLTTEAAEGEIGLDVKWLPNPDTAIDLTLNPDFSQVESDVAQITANERFALFYPEKRPFFMERTDLFGTPFRAVYTRTITDPAWGARATGQWGKNSYTVLAADDQGGGSVIIPGPEGSDLADQDYESLVGVATWRRDVGDESFVSVLYSGREIDGGGHNRVFGPDFEWRPTDADIVTGQLLFSHSETPVLPDLADEWDGRTLSGHALELWWYHGTRTWDCFGLVQDVSDGFRADNGFVPRVGYRRGIVEGGYTFWPEDGRVKRLRVFVETDYVVDMEGEVLARDISPGLGLDGPWSSFFRTELRFDEVSSEGELFPRKQLFVYLQVSPSSIFTDIGLEGLYGDEVDYEHSRPGTGGTLNLSGTIRPSDHLELRLNAGRRWLEVDSGEDPGGRLFTAHVGRIRGTYTFSARSYLRLIGQYVETTRDPSLYEDEVDEKDSSLSGSVLFAYKLNWQSVLYLGYGDNRELVNSTDLEPESRQVFLKVSYAFQR